MFEEISWRHKLKLLYLKEIFEQQTDKEHGLTIAELMREMEKKGISVKERTLREDVLSLQDYMDDHDFCLEDNIKADKEKARPLKFAMTKRAFTTSEVKLLMECVRNIHSLSERQTETLLKKLEGLCSHAEARKIRTQMARTNGFKAYWHKNHHDVLLRNIELIDEAIELDRKISFKYFWYTSVNICI